MKGTQMPPLQAANLVENNGNTAYRVESIHMFSFMAKFWEYTAKREQSLSDNVNFILTVGTARCYDNLRCLKWR